MFLYELSVAVLESGDVALFSFLSLALVFIGTNIPYVPLVPTTFSSLNQHILPKLRTHSSTEPNSDISIRPNLANTYALRLGLASPSPKLKESQRIALPSQPLINCK